MKTPSRVPAILMAVSLVGSASAQPSGGVSHVEMKLEVLDALSSNGDRLGAVAINGKFEFAPDLPQPPEGLKNVLVTVAVSWPKKMKSARFWLAPGSAGTATAVQEDGTIVPVTAIELLVPQFQASPKRQWLSKGEGYFEYTSGKSGGRQEYRLLFQIPSTEMLKAISFQSFPAVDPVVQPGK